MAPQIAVGGGDDSRIRSKHARAAQPLELTLLEDTQELGLGRRAHLRDLVARPTTSNADESVSGTGNVIT